ncbi:MAG: hypothetical protein ACC619_05315, partial [Paracoccaceae bacterium]
MICSGGETAGAAPSPASPVVSTGATAEQRDLAQVLGELSHRYARRPVRFRPVFPNIIRPPMIRPTLHPEAALIPQSPYLNRAARIQYRHTAAVTPAPRELPIG